MNKEFIEKMINICEEKIAKKGLKKGYVNLEDNLKLKIKGRIKTLKNIKLNEVTKKYDHDWLHELFAYHDQPLYVRLLRDPNLAWCDKDKWETLSDEEKLQCTAEEVYVISTERFLVPNDWKYPAKRAFMKSTDKVCTTLCSGWFRDFAIDNYPKVLQMFDQQKFNAVQQMINSTPEFKRKFYNGNQS